MSSLLALASAALFGIADFSGGVASRVISPWRVVAWSQLIGVPILLIGIPIVGYSEVSSTDIAYGAAGGLVGVVGIYALYRALADGTMSIVSPITASITAVIPLLVGLALGESISSRQWTGIVAAIVAIVLVVQAPSGGKISKSVVLHALLAAASFATFFVLLDQTSDTSGLWPLVGMRLVSLPIAFAVVAYTSTLAVPTGRVVAPLVLAGIADMAANIAVLLALQSGPLGITAVISALYPAFTALAAVAVLKERPRPTQIVGIVLAMGAVLLLAV